AGLFESSLDLFIKSLSKVQSPTPLLFLLLSLEKLPSQPCLGRDSLTSLVSISTNKRVFHSRKARFLAQKVVMRAFVGLGNPNDLDIVFVTDLLASLAGDLAPFNTESVEFENIKKWIYDFKPADLLIEDLYLEVNLFQSSNESLFTLKKK